MTELARGNRINAGNVLKRARGTALGLPTPDSDAYTIEWTDILVARQALAEAEATFEQAGRPSSPTRMSA